MIDQLASFDVETTGTDPETDRIVSAFVGLHRPDGSLVKGRRWLMDPGVPIPREATAVHGITTQQAVDEGISPIRGLMEIEADLSAAIALGIPLVVMNAPFDLTMLDREIDRYFERPLSFVPHPVLDPLVLDKAVDVFRPGKRNLGALCAHYGIPFDPEEAHDAEVDAIATAALIGPVLEKVTEHALEKGYPPEAITLDAVHAWSTKWRERQTDGLVDHWRSIGKAVDDADHPRDWPLIPRPTFTPTPHGCFGGAGSIVTRTDCECPIGYDHTLADEPYRGAFGTVPPPITETSPA